MLDNLSQTFQQIYIRMTSVNLALLFKFYMLMSSSNPFYPEYDSSRSYPFYPEYDSSRSYPFYPEYDSGRTLHLARLPRTLTFWNPIGWLTPNDVSISGSLGNPYFSTNHCRSLGICRPKSAPPSQSEIKDGVESQRSLNVDVFRRITPLIYFILLMTRRQTRG